MSKPNYENRKLQSRNGLAPCQRSASGKGKPVAFARQLAEARQNSRVSIPSRLQSLFARFVRCMQPIQRLFKRRGRRRKLDIVDLQQLGEKRFVAILRVGKQKFLISGAAGSITLLAEIDTRRVTPIAPRPLGQESA
jgi:hypothetical protein